MTDAEWVGRARSFVAGPYPVMNGRLAPDEPPPEWPEILIEWRGPGAWAITQANHCLTKRGDWIYEPLCSSRTPSFIKRTRHASATEALAAWEKWRAKTISKHHKSEGHR